MKIYGDSTVHLSQTVSPKPAEFERSAAALLSHYLSADVYFLPRSGLKTADVRANGQFWEIKSPIGNGKRTIQNNLRTASEQAKNMVLDLRRCKIRDDRAIRQAKYEFALRKALKRLVVITKSQKVVEIMR